MCLFPRAAVAHRRSIAALVVAVFIFKVAFDLIRTGLGELLERSLPDETEQEILGSLRPIPRWGSRTTVRTRRIGAADWPSKSHS